MKQYNILIIIVLFITGSLASENPFEISPNFKQIDKEQDVLLSALKSESKNIEKRQEEVLFEKKVTPELQGEVEVEKKPVKHKQSRIESDQKEIPVPLTKATVKPQATDKKGKENVVQTKKNKEKKIENKAIATKKGSQIKIDKKVTDKKKQLTQPKIKETRTSKKDQDTATASTVKTAKKISHNKAEIVALSKLKKEQKALEKKVKKVKKVPKRIDQAVSKKHKNIKKAPLTKEPKRKKEDVKSVVSDINITKEQMEAAKRADEIMKRAILEVDQVE